ncbi:MAG: SNF2-related protein [Nitriliruptoraceae bacterium]
MTSGPELSFVPGVLAPAAGWFALWGPGADGAPGSARPPVVRSGLPVGVESRCRLRIAGDAVVEREVQRLPMLATVRALAALPAGSEQPAWARPSPSVRFWSVVAKLGLELVAGGRALPSAEVTDVPGELRALWRVAASGDDRPRRLAQLLPAEAAAVPTPGGGSWDPYELVLACLDAVADACAREGRRPELDPRRRGPRRPWAQMWADALTGSDPTVAQLRVAAEDLADDVAAWADPVLGRTRRTAARLRLTLVPQATPDDADDGLVATEPWTLKLGLSASDDPRQGVDAAQVWASGGEPLAVGGRTVGDPEAALAVGLASAARLFAPLDRALDERRPTAVELTPEEVATLLGDGRAALGAAGVVVELPGSLADAGTRELRLRVRIGSTAAGPPRTATDDGLALASLTDLRYEVALGDDTLTSEEFHRIVDLKAPLVRWRGRWVRVDHGETDRIAALAGRTAALRLTEALAAALSGTHHSRELGPVPAVADGELLALLERLRGADAPAAARIVGIAGELRPYQQRGVAWLQRLSELGMGGVLADEMGLGKTLQAIALLTSRPQDRPHLVVCPTSVVGNWERELARFAPGVEVVRHHGTDRAVTSRAFRPGAVVVTSYALLRRDLGLLEDATWDVVVLDEAQQIKNPSSKGARAARALTARTRVAMTGTPLENRLSELWAIIDVTNPGLLGSQRAFTERYGVPIERWHDQEAAGRLRRLIAPFVLRRRKDDPEVAVDLPAKQELTVTCGLTREQAALYQATVEEAFGSDALGGTSFERRGRILALLTALKQICNHPRQYLRDDGALAGRSGKLARATELLSELVDAGDRVLVFTQYREMGALLAEHLEDRLDLPEVPFLHGGLSLPARDELVRRFQEDDDAPPVLLVSLRAGGTGLNLTRASHVLHFDRWWNPAVEDQATDRAHRIGQRRTVTVHRLVTAGTLEERIDELLGRKRALADAVVGSGEAWVTELDDDALRELVALSSDHLEISDDEEERGEEAGGDGSVPDRPHLVAIPGGRR